MTVTDAVGGVIDRLLERRYGARFSSRWWVRHHTSTHRSMVMLACPYCPDAVELGRMVLRGPVIASYNDIQQALLAVSESDRVSNPTETPPDRATNV